MIVIEEEGDILLSQAQSLVCPVNTTGAMGKGLAKAFKDAYPSLYPAYLHACKTSHFVREGLFVHTVRDGRKIVCLPTKRHWRYPSKIQWIDQGLYVLATSIERLGIASLAVPAIGCGEGKLEWKHVRPLIVQYLDPIETPVALYKPWGR